MSKILKYSFKTLIITEVFHGLKMVQHTLTLKANADIVNRFDLI